VIIQIISNFASASKEAFFYLGIYPSFQNRLKTFFELL